MTNLNARFMDAQKALKEFAGRDCWFCGENLHDANRHEDHGHVCTPCGDALGAELHADCGKVQINTTLME